MARMRKPFEGVWNIIRFNRHFYLLAFGMLSAALLLANFVGEAFRVYFYALSLFIAVPAAVSLLVSFYVYDLSDLYKLTWLKDIEPLEQGKIVNIHAGFDETSLLLKEEFKNSELIVLDFYDPAVHTEVSIKRARKAYPSFPNTRPVVTSTLPLADSSTDKVFVILSAHEIGETFERSAFFGELNRVLTPTGEIIVVEHLRDIPNFLAYNVGAFHFYSRKSWVDVFKAGNLEITREIKITPFISTFILKKYGTPS